jgi:integral membrane protein
VTPLKLFRITAVAEACSWAGLLVGMFFKHIAQTSEVGVQVMGPIHGVAFLAYVVAALVVGGDAGWSKRLVAVAVLASIPPLATVALERWATRRGIVPAAWGRPADA